YMTEFRDKELAEGLAQRISSLLACSERSESNGRSYTIMEVCGTHTMNIFRYGLKGLLPASLKLLSGPGCPVCVTPASYIDQAIALAHHPGVIICTFGDMLKVPGSRANASLERLALGNIKVVYSTMDALYTAQANPNKKVVFLGVGFETTAPTIAASVLEADRKGLKNYFVLCAHKTMPQVMRALVEDKALGLQGFICPAHVSTIIGSRPYEFLAREFGIPCVIAGFEPLDILHGIYMLLGQIVRGKARVEIQYSRVAKPEGNPRAQAILEEVFEPCDVEWRGIGVVPMSGLKLRGRYKKFDAALHFSIPTPKVKEPKGCLCGDMLRGVKTPPDCPLFGRACTPSDPVGPCMVSSEGTCAAWFKYQGEIVQ
ncbi:MAG TPA: hydrogenase formation protein HypD, partial [Candidatus Hypogeohydataceae bacterium YC40]